MDTQMQRVLKAGNILLFMLLFAFVVVGAASAAPAAETGETGAAPGAPAKSESQPAQNVKIEGLNLSCPPEFVPLIQKTVTGLMSDNFTFYPIKTLDPFVPFISPIETPPPQVRTEEEGEPKEPQKPLTPLQKMSLGEIESGLKAITWGELGRRAVIEDSTGKGYIVTVGTPVGERNGVVTQILNDRLVIQQEIWDKPTKQMVPQDVVVKLSKKSEK